MKLNRYEPSDEELKVALRAIAEKLDYRLKEKGRGIFVSSHEIMGIVDEEVHEYHTAVQMNSPDKQRKELLDIAVAAVFGMVSINSGKMDRL